MAKVNICDVTVLDNPSPFRNPFQFEITFECLEDLKDGESNQSNVRCDLDLLSFSSETGVS